MADTLAFLSTVGFAACIGFAALTVVLYFVFKIPDVIGELSGRKLPPAAAAVEMLGEVILVHSDEIVEY